MAYVATLVAKAGSMDTISDSVVMGWLPVDGEAGGFSCFM